MSSVSSKSKRLAERLAAALGTDISDGKLPPGTHLVAQAIANQHGVSRSPVNEALDMLIVQGYARKEVNRGVFVAHIDGAAVKPASVDADPIERTYFRLAEDRLAERLPATVSAKQICQSYGLTQSQVQALLTRIIKEGWLERRAGYGFAFTEMLDSADALVQTYRMRLALEPSALLEPGYHLDLGDLRELRKVEEHLLNGGIESMSAEDLYDRGVRFHETIIGASRNPFFLDAVKRINSVRRLLAYRSMSTRSRYFSRRRSTWRSSISWNSADALIVASAGLKKQRLRCGAMRQYPKRGFKLNRG
jgi:DNA-binding GntR family transcriptional regulator